MRLVPRSLPLLLLIAASTASCVETREVTSPDTAEPAPPGQPPGTSAEAPAREIERMVFDLVNDERRERGRSELEWDDQLADLAREWSQRMAAQGQLEHQDGEPMLERSEGFATVGENIFRATGPVPASTIHVGWMRSDGHRANVLREAFDRLGVGVLCTHDGQVWATQRFGGTSGGDPRPSDEVPPEQPIVASEGQGPRCPGTPGNVELELDGIGSPDRR